MKARLNTSPLNLSALILLLLFSSELLKAQIIKPIGCYAGTNGTHADVLAHSEARGALLTEKWSNIETAPGVYDFSSLDAKIQTVSSAGKKHALAISVGAFGSPDWLMDSLNVPYHSFQYQNNTWRLPLWWDTVCKAKLSELITKLGARYANTILLSHVYVSQMTVNGIEGHLNGVDMIQFKNDGYTDEKWIAAAKETTLKFAEAFPKKPIVFEVHEIDRDTLVPANIMADLAKEEILCERLGLGMWWISGKTTYQANMLKYIENFQGDIYAQVIGRSDQTHRFKDSLYSTVFEQAKHLNVRYIEPWPYEFQHHTHDSIIKDFNDWSDANFNKFDTCLIDIIGNSVDEYTGHRVQLYPNPATNEVYINLASGLTTFNVAITDLNGRILLEAANTPILDVSELPSGIYVLKVIHDAIVHEKRLMIQR